ncbi:hypothetical protein, partial [Caballeronia grimmiae]
MLRVDVDCTHREFQEHLLPGQQTDFPVTAHQGVEEGNVCPAARHQFRQRCVGPRLGDKDGRVPSLRQLQKTTQDNLLLISAKKKAALKERPKGPS